MVKQAVQVMVRLTGREAQVLRLMRAVELRIF
jgi:hypothetical protein